MEREVAVCWMKFDSRLPYRLSTPRAWLIVEQGKGHNEFLFAPGELRTLKGLQADSEGLGRFATTPQSKPIVRL
jgi:hypothetical protein